ncbi:shikimate dehydrogenase [Sedimentitalea todarodis]|uniref:Shikimate dehydrogenase (NADP(+)) n=1 Tax=Sedimentitalea todarodis TaxID=1631240 RepID=A0ABU3VIN4_9RHOB|nr:shikimate dehydrogenase [Sedimentitalea todarodis]MDU9006052.1 shikimate dehydrogenase [Sedimentitalea todarodis]
MTSTRIPLAGVIGSPIAHSRSPLLHAHWLRTYSIRGHYIPMDVDENDLERVLRTLPAMGFVGVNVTVPHKERVMAFADQITDRATLIGAANTLIFRNAGSIFADNTDGYGFIENLRSGAPNWCAEAGPALVLGAGGASRAVITALIDAGVPEVILSNRTRLRAERLREDFGHRIRVIDWVQAGSTVKEAALLVNTTSLGMTGQPELSVQLDGLHSGTVVTDLVYSPLQTNLLVAARNVGCVTVDGLGMLLFQAVPGFERWFGTRPEIDEATRAAALK